MSEIRDASWWLPGNPLERVRLKNIIYVYTNFRLDLLGLATHVVRQKTTISNLALRGITLIYLQILISVNVKDAPAGSATLHESR